MLHLLHLLKLWAYTSDTVYYVHAC